MKKVKKYDKTYNLPDDIELDDSQPKGSPKNPHEKELDIIESVMGGNSIEDFKRVVSETPHIPSKTERGRVNTQVNIKARKVITDYNGNKIVREDFHEHVANSIKDYWKDRVGLKDEDMVDTTKEQSIHDELEFE